MKQTSEGIFSCDRHGRMSAIAPGLDYRPTCPECNAELKEVLQDIEEDFGDRLTKTNNKEER